MLGKILLLLDKGGGLEGGCEFGGSHEKGRCEEAPNASVSEAPKLRRHRSSYTNPHTSTHGRFHTLLQGQTPIKTVTSSRPTTIHITLPRHQHILDLSGIMQAWHVSRAGHGVGVEELKVVAYQYRSFS